MIGGFLHQCGKLFELAVALIVKGAVGADLRQSNSLPPQLHLLQLLEYDLSSDQLCVLFIVLFHLSSVEGDLSHAFIVFLGKQI